MPFFSEAAGMCFSAPPKAREETHRGIRGVQIATSEIAIRMQETWGYHLGSRLWCQLEQKDSGEKVEMLNYRIQHFIIKLHPYPLFFESCQSSMGNIRDFSKVDNRHYYIFIDPLFIFALNIYWAFILCPVLESIQEFTGFFSYSESQTEGR